MHILITGGHGFVGPHLRRHLENQGHTVASPLFDQMDVREFEQVRHWITTFRPDQIFHLAAVSWPGESLREPFRSVEINTMGTTNVLEAVRTTGSHAKVLITGTSEEYGYEGREDGEIISETSVCRPTTPYGASKLYGTTLGQVYVRRYGMHVINTRAWNHTGWGRQPVNAESSFARKIVAVERGRESCVTHGDLSAWRNFTSVRDVVRAYASVIDAEPGIYNVCSTLNVPMERIMNELIAMASKDIELKPDPSLGAVDHGPWPVPANGKIHEATGWLPEVSLRNMLSDVMSYWRSQ